MPLNTASPNAFDTFDVLLVGSGAAGLYAALCIPTTYRIGLITKDVLTQSASDWAQGGIAAAIAPEDSPRLHRADTLQAGAGLCEGAAVDQLVEQATYCIQALVELGVPFDRQGVDLALTLEAAHSHKRVLHAADTTGRAVVATLAAAVRQRPHITILEHTFVLDLWRGDGGCRGVIALHQNTLCWIAAGAVVLSTGGGGQVFAETTNPAASTGDGVATAWRAGAQLRDLEFFQFHPTALKVAGAPRFLISEAVRGEGAHLIDAQGYRFAFDYHPQGELAPRDVVSRAIYRHLQAQADPGGWVGLDLREIPRDRIHHRFPNILQVCQRWGVDPLSQPIPVSPAAHYWMGGVVTDLDSQTGLPGLYAVGETASTGVHGANRLASNSLLECLVYGRQLVHLTVTLPQPPPATFRKTLIQQLPHCLSADGAILKTLRAEIPQIMWQGAGICRNATGLAIALEAITQGRQTFTALATSKLLANCLDCPGAYPIEEGGDHLRLWGETRNLLDLAWLILRSAQFRTESRGGHYREDYPHPKETWQVHTLVECDRWFTSAPIV
ncbi:L-aspartate oxidase [Leptolyngbya sp. PCC 6406]|uniref:L-aspartate oxidase n=1 Tax=Leptolyngbya sp. PCC 6406 TaxID=1173264 RepID=UPI0002AC7249|nr:L-aspartate oxidase [Leptolyngbya sp. PCC 6406]